MTAPHILVVDPAHFEVAYTINPWMRPGSWSADPAGQRQAARTAFSGLCAALEASGARVEILPGAPGAPDLVFPANAAVVLNGQAILAHFRHVERQIEEPHIRRAFEDLQRRDVIGELAFIPEGEVQEGAGDFIADEARSLFWAGYGPRSTLGGARFVAETLGVAFQPLELATEQFYHLDTCFCPLPRGEVLYYPPAFTQKGLGAIRERTPKDLLLEASAEDAARFCVNAVALGDDIIMAEADERLRARLTERGYRVREVNLAPFILSGGGAYCMTLRLDRISDMSTPSLIPTQEPAQ